MKRIFWISMAVLLVLLAGCNVLPSRPPVTLYQPQPQFPPRSGQVKPVEWRLGLARPSATGQLITPRILVQPVPGEIEVYPQARWAQVPSGLLGDALFRAFEADARVAMLDHANSGRFSDFELAAELRDFQLELEGGPQAVIGVKLQLVGYPAGRILASHVLQARAPARSQQAPDAVAAFGDALQDLLPQIVDWSVAQGEAAWAQRESDSGQ